MLSAAFKKKRLMVVVGAGCSMELEMPGSSDLDKLFDSWASKDGFVIAETHQSLYGYIRDNIHSYYSLNPKPSIAKRTNFEEVLYTMLQLSSVLTDKTFNFPMNAFITPKRVPWIIPVQDKYKKREGRIVRGSDFRDLVSFLLDRMTEELRHKCIEIQDHESPEFVRFKKFMTRLRKDYDVAFISLNYDNLVMQACPDLFTGFDRSGVFRPERVHNRCKWDLIYYVHGSVHYDMQGDVCSMHDIKWNPDLKSHFCGNSYGRNSQETAEGVAFPLSVLIAGYGKLHQMQRLPFVTYYSQIDRIVNQADAFLFLGYGFNDMHLNTAFYSVAKRPRPVVVVDQAENNEDPFNFRKDSWSDNLRCTLPVEPGRMSSRGHVCTPQIGELKENHEFEVSINPDIHLAIWYGGFMDLCEHYEKMKSELEQEIVRKN